MAPRLLIKICGMLLILSACNGGQELEAAQEPPPSPTSTATPAGTSGPGDEGPADEDGEEGDDIQWASCEHPSGVSVDYPEGWHVNEGSTLPACSAFDPEPLDVPEATEFLSSAVLLTVEPVDFAAAADPQSRTGEVIEEREQMVDGHDAVRFEQEAQGDALLEEGTRTTRWLIVLDREETLTLVTHQVGDPQEYESNQRILDLMVPRLQLPDGN